MNDKPTYPQIVQADGPRPRKRTPQQKEATRRQSRRDAQTTIIRLSDYAPRPLSWAWQDARKDRQFFLGNFYRHLDEVLDADVPAPFSTSFEIAEQIGIHIIKAYVDRGLPIDLPDPPTPVSAALGVRRAA